jgi:hypothetical protein
MAFEVAVSRASSKPEEVDGCHVAPGDAPRLLVDLLIRTAMRKVTIIAAGQERKSVGILGGGDPVTDLHWWPLRRP